MMGGRGASAGRAKGESGKLGSGGRNQKSAMRGSEKQIKYAMDILAEVKKEAEKNIASAERRIAESGHPRAIKAKDQAKAILSAAKEIEISNIHASTVIDRLYSYHKFFIWLDEYKYDTKKFVGAMIRRK